MPAVERIFMVEPSAVHHDAAAAVAKALEQRHAVEATLLRGEVAGVADRVSADAEPGIALCIHSSYYFSAEDGEELVQLRRRGWRVIVLENDDACWVTRMMWACSNATHPQFAAGRFDRLRRALSAREIRFQAAAALPLIEPRQAELLGGFFRYGSGRVQLPGREPDEQLARAWQALSGTGTFAYRVLVA
jgi:hypothetical protein